MIVYGSTLSPFVRKVMVFAEEKGLEIELKPNTAPEFKETSPFGKMPGFRDGDFTLSDSTAIVTYLDAVQPEPNLIPLDPKNRARTIWYEEFGDTMVAACGSKIFVNRIVAPRFFKRDGDLAAADEAQKTEFPKLMDYLENVIPASGYLVEDRFTLADIAVVSPLITMSHADCSVCDGSHPKSAAYVAAISARPSFAKLIAREKAMLAA